MPLAHHKFESEQEQNPKTTSRKGTMKIINIATITILSTIRQCKTFTVEGRNGVFRTQQRQQGPVGTVLSATSDKNDNAGNNRKARTCIRNFLTQRSIQSFMWLLETMRDPHTNVWMENFLNSKNLLQYHGSAALDLERFSEWDSVFQELIPKPADIVIIEIKTNGQGKGLSKNNPYRKMEVS
jgi:hypothetical protein